MSSNFVFEQRRGRRPDPASAAGGGHSALRRLRSEEDGVALTEFALVLPLLMILFLGMLDFGKAFNYWIDQTHLANQGARWAAVNKNPGGVGMTLQQYIVSKANTDELKTGGTKNVPNALEVCVAFPNAGNSNVGEPVQVTVKTTYKWLPIIGDALGGILTTSVKGQATMRIEAKPTNYGTGGNIGSCT